jgi:hypothetical protein
MEIDCSISMLSCAVESASQETIIRRAKSQALEIGSGHPSPDGTCFTKPHQRNKADQGPRCPTP